MRNAVISTDKREKKNLSSLYNMNVLKHDFQKDPLDEKMEQSILSPT